MLNFFPGLRLTYIEFFNRLATDTEPVYIWILKVLGSNCQSDFRHLDTNKRIETPFNFISKHGTFIFVRIAWVWHSALATVWVSYLPYLDVYSPILDICYIATQAYARFYGTTNDSWLFPFLLSYNSNRRSSQHQIINLVNILHLNIFTFKFNKSFHKYISVFSFHTFTFLSGIQYIHTWHKWTQILFCFYLL